MPGRAPGRRQDLVWVSPSRAPRIASSCAWRWVACTTKSEIRGHRRTYIGSMPGKISAEPRRKSAVRNPLFLLDEVDKMGHGFSWRSGICACSKCSIRNRTIPFSRSLHRSGLRPVGRDVRRDVELAEHSGGAYWTAWKMIRLVGLHRRREAVNIAQKLPAAEAD